MEIKSFLRIRPLQITNKNLYSISEDKKTLTIKESASVSPILSEKRRSSISLSGPPTDQDFKFDKVFDMDSTQNELFKTSVQPLVEDALNKSQIVGIMSFGENQSGKSYSIFGADNIQQEEFSIDQEDPQDTRGIALKAMNYIFKKARSEGQFVNLECQMIDLYLDTFRDLSIGKQQSKMQHRMSLGSLTIESNKDIEVEEIAGGEVKIANAQNVKISNTKEAANFIEKCVNLYILDYQKKLEKDNGQLTLFAHTFFIMNITYGKEIHSQVYFIDLGSSERKNGRKQKEGFIVANGLQSLQKLLQTLQTKLTEEDREILQYKDNKLTYILKNLYKEYTKLNIIFHLSINETNLESCLKTLEISDRIRNYGGKAQNPDNNSQQLLADDDENAEMTIDQLIQHLNKENFDLRNQIDTLKRSHKIKLEELQQLLILPCEIEYLLKNKDQAPEMQDIHEQRKAMEKADHYFKSNKDLEKRIDFFAFDLQELKKEKKIQQEAYSQKFIVLGHQIEQLKEEKECHRLDLENKLRMNKAYSVADLNQVTVNNNHLVKMTGTVSSKLKQNELFKEDFDMVKVNNEIDDIKEAVKGLFDLQVKAQEKEKQRMQEQFESQIKSKQEQIQKLINTYQKYKQEKDLQIKQSSEELQRLYEIFIKQDQIIQGLKRGDYSGGNNQAKIPEQDLIPLPSGDKYPKQKIQLYKIIEKQQQQFSYKKYQTARVKSPSRNQQMTTNLGHQKMNSEYYSNQKDLQGTLHSTTNPMMQTGQDTNSQQFQAEMVKQNVNDMEYNQLMQYVLALQNEIKNIKRNPLNPDNVRVEKIKELLDERERYKDLYVSESIKNKDYNNGGDNMETMTQNRNIHSSASKRPMTTISSSTMRGGFFVTQLHGGRPISRAQQISGQQPRRNIVIKQGF